VVTHVAGELETALSGRKVRVTSAALGLLRTHSRGAAVVYDLGWGGGDAGQPGRTQEEKRRRWVGETYWRRIGENSSVVYATPDAVGDDEVEEIRLKPDARVLREGSADWLKLFDEGIPKLVDLVRKAVEEGYDAVRVGEALAILSGVAIAERDNEEVRKRREERKRNRGGWMRLR
jgi:hypothetical protein